MKVGIRLLASLMAFSLATPPAWAQLCVTGEQGTTSDPADESSSYGPLSFNVAGGGDFYIAQNGHFVPAKLIDGVIEFRIRPTPFEIGYNGEQANMCLATSHFEEIRADPDGYKASCLAGPMSGARYPNSDELLVYSGKIWSDGNTELSDNTTLKAEPIAGYEFAYGINKLTFVATPDMSLGSFRGTFLVTW